jgi:hypothetical protein
MTRLDNRAVGTGLPGRCRRARTRARGPAPVTADAAPPRRARHAAALAGCAVAILAALAGAAPASAAGQDVPGPQIAAALRSSPLYVDPSLSSAFPAPARSALLSAIRKAPVPVYILAVPLVSGGQWATDQQLADVVQNTLGRPGVYLTLDDSFSDGVDAWTWPSDPQGLDAPPWHAADAAQAADIEQGGTPDAPVWQTFLRTVQLITSGKAVSAFNAALAAQGNPGGQAASPSSDGGAVAGGVLAAVAVAGTVTVAGLRRRRRRHSARHAYSQAPPSPPSHSVAAAARAATEADLRDRAQRELIELGELLEQPGPGSADGTPAPRSGEGDADLTRALDAYDAAGKTLDSAAGIPDLAGVLVLTHLGRCAAGAAQARQAGQPAPPATMLCFFNPLHGEGLHQVRWRERGGQQALEVHACATCADAVAQRRYPDVLTGTSGRLDVPWYEAAGDVWADTGYGQFSTDGLIRRILDR